MALSAWQEGTLRGTSRGFSGICVRLSGLFRSVRFDGHIVSLWRRGREGEFGVWAAKRVWSGMYCDLQAEKTSDHFGLSAMFDYLTLDLSSEQVLAFDRHLINQFRMSPFVPVCRFQSFFVSIHVDPEERGWMKKIDGGSFKQGGVERLGVELLNSVRSVTIKPFAMGKYEVTLEEYDRFAIATGRRLPEDQGWGRGQRPAINVSWDDAKDYATWLSQATGKQYRLPSESEWEYAA